VLRTVAALLLAAGLACAASPAAAPTRVIPAGVSVAGIRVGGLSAEPARQRVEAAFTRPVLISYQHKTMRISPRQVAAAISVDSAVTSALAATPRSDIALPIRYSDTRLAKLVAYLAHRFDRPAVDTTVVGADGNGPQFTPTKTGLAVDQKTMRAALGQLLQQSTRPPLQLITHPVQPRVTPANYGPVIVISRSSNTLVLYDGTQAVQSFHVATGQARYPTPAGLWHIVTMQRDPWWYPPTQDEWAKGLKPVPPGPDNPLGTRWMGLDAAGVGIHGTDAPTSIGYSVSHGCIRMQVPEAEWLFEHVRVGTPVIIL
jgi:lipoprotein-anchoring transpeptidase ErfK/SrfK